MGNTQDSAPLDAADIRRRLHQPELPLAVEPSVGSTNTRLAERRDNGEALSVLMAEHQSAGRGRHGRQWLSPPGCGLYLSMAREFARPASALSALSLVAGLAAADAVSRHSRIQVGLKWPNDLQVGGRKLGGCLIDLKQAGQRPCLAIVGIGINVDLGRTEGPDQPWTDLVREGGSNDRNHLAAQLILSLHRDLALFDQAGFTALRARWDAHDVLRGRVVRVSGGQADIEGRSVGVDPGGSLLLQSAGGMRTVHAGEISVRALEPS